MASFSFVSPLKGSSLDTYKLWVSATAVAGNSLTVVLKTTNLSENVTLEATSEGGSLGTQFLNGNIQIPADTGTVALDISVTDNTTATQADITVGEQHMANNNAICYLVIGANDSGGDNDYNDVLVVLYASADSYDNT